MRLLGFEITRTKSGAPPGSFPPNSLGGGMGWFPIIRESFSGAWQRNQEIRVDTVLANTTVFRCVTMPANDIAKLCIDLVAEDSNGIWSPTTSPAFSPVLTKPNRFQNRIQFVETWLTSKISRGNAYVLKERDNRGVVVALYVLNPLLVHPLVAPDGSVYYQLGHDYLSGVAADLPAVPASEIIHDRWNCLYHPLVGLSPLYAAGMAAVQGMAIQNMSSAFFGNGARPGGILTAPGAIADETAARLKATWDAGFTGENAGKVAVLGDGLKFESMIMTSADAQLIEQLKWTAETICGVFGVPAYKLNVGAQPLNNNVEALEQQYYSQCLQIHIESLELCLEEGLALPSQYGISVDLDGLLRMDQASQIKTLSDGVVGGVYKPNEARRRLNLGPVAGGDQVYLQQQNYSLMALAKRDAKDDPFGSAKSPAPVDPTPTPAEPPKPKALKLRALDVLAAADDFEARVASEPWREAA